MKVSIKYCVMWNFFPQASRVEQELKTNIDHIQVELIKGSDGVFEVRANGRLIFSKVVLGRFPDEGEITRWINEI